MKAHIEAQNDRTHEPPFHWDLCSRERFAFLAEREAVVVVPTGSTAQHDPHLPLARGTVIASGIATRAVKRAGERVTATFPPKTVPLAAIRASKGTLLAVDDDTILSACRSLALDETILVEPAAAVGFAAIPEALERGVIRKGEHVVCVLTGHGLKDIDPVAQSLPTMVTITAEKSEFMNAYGNVKR